MVGGFYGTLIGYLPSFHEIPWPANKIQEFLYFILVKYSKQIYGFINIPF